MQPIRDARTADGPPPPPLDQSGSRWSTAAVVGAVVLALLVVLVVFGAAFLFLGVSIRGSDAPQQPVQQIAAPVGAPEGDFFTVLRPGELLGPAAHDRLVRLLGPDPFMDGIVDDSVLHVADARTGWQTVSIFTWQANGVRPDGVQELMRCSGHFFDRGSSAGCGTADLDDQLMPPSVGLGTDEVTRNVSVHDAPPDAAWMVVQTELGARAVSNVIAGSGYVQWPNHAGEPLMVTLFDEDLTELWSEAPFRR